MDKNAVLDALKQSRDKLSPYHVSALYLFGSAVRGDAGPDSDIDIIVDFEPGASIGLFGFTRLQRTLSEIIGRPVDLVTRDALHKRLRERILKEAIRAA